MCTHFFVNIVCTEVTNALFLLNNIKAHFKMLNNNLSMIENSEKTEISVELHLVQYSKLYSPDTKASLLGVNIFLKPHVLQITLIGKGLIIFIPALLNK